MLNLDNYLNRMNSKLDQIDRMVKRGGGRGRGSGGSNGALETLAQESFDILTLIPTYIENTKEAIGVLSEETKVNYILLNVYTTFLLKSFSFKMASTNYTFMCFRTNSWRLKSC